MPSRESVFGQGPDRPNGPDRERDIRDRADHDQRSHGRRTRRVRLRFVRVGRFFALVVQQVPVHVRGHDDAQVRERLTHVGQLGMLRVTTLRPAKTPLESRRHQCRSPRRAVNRPMCDERDGCECSGSVRACARTMGGHVAHRSSRERVALAFTVLVSVVLLGGCDWTMYRSGAAHTGTSPGETVIGTSNVATLSEAWSTPSSDALAHWGDGTGPPIVAGGRVYAQREDGFLSVYDAQGIGNCGGSPKECLPLWRAQVEEGPGDHDGGPGIPAVAGGVVYVAHGRFDDGVLSAFDAAGTGCSGSPPTCQPLWTARLGAGFVAPPTVAGGIVYVTGINDFANVLFGFDATGQQGCTGTPTVCAPLWTATFGPRTPFGDPGLARQPSRADASSCRVRATRCTYSTQPDSRTATAHPRNVPNCGRLLFLSGVTRRSLSAGYRRQP